MIKLELDTRPIERKLSDIARKQMPFAIALASNDVATAIKNEMPEWLEKDLDRPTPFTRRAGFTVRASKRNPVAIVGHKDAQAVYLRFQSKGGVRRPKKKAIVVPVGQRRNKYGNMTKGALARELAKPNTFAGKVNGVGGIWQRPKGGKRRRTTTGKSGGRNGLKLLAAFHTQAAYKPRLRFEPRAEQLARATYSKRLALRLDQSVSTAKRR